MHGSITRPQEYAFAVIAVAICAIVVATPIATLDANAPWRERVAATLTTLEALLSVVRRVLGL